MPGARAGIDVTLQAPVVPPREFVGLNLDIPEAEVGPLRDAGRESSFVQVAEHFLRRAVHEREDRDHRGEPATLP
jgi:hypothetical protein